jgi:hypothetical protein
MKTISISKWTDWADIANSATLAGGKDVDCSWLGVDTTNTDNAILSYNNDKIDSQIFESQFSNQNFLQIKKAAEIKNIQGLRANEYPPITDYLDGIVKNDQQQIEAYIQACLDVKAKYPKS